MRYLSVCSGIEAATLAWHPLGWQAAGFAEIDRFPSAVLAHHYGSNMPGDPLARNGVPNFGDFTTIEAEHVGPIDLLVGGTPCQSFSIAGLRGGLADDRGNLALEFLRLAQRTRPRWLVWENVPGVLSSNGGRDFGAIVAGMVDCGYGIAYRVLDAQYVRVDGFERAVPQRRRRVFVVGYLGDWRRAAAVLFERQGLSGDTAPCRETGERIADSLTVGVNQYSGFCGEPVAHCPPVSPALKARDYKGPSSDGDGDGDGAPLVAHSLRGTGFDASEDGTGRGTPIVPVAFDCKASGRNGFGVGDTSPTLRAMGHANSHQNAGGQVAVTTLAIRGRGESHQLETRDDVTANAVLTPNGGRAGIGVGAVHYDLTARRLTPVECERLQGIPDGYTAIPWRGKPADQCPDGPRYKAIGNSMAVNCMRWIGQRIEMVDGMVSHDR